MIFKLCYLFTFIASILNLLGIIALKWSTIFMPSIIALSIKILLIIVCVAIGFIASK
ncbi:hypothetical protein LZ906_017330 (plasmid) [Paraclostridium ghonii]|uniref:hypothetical protein n=1 Tax=Paraclostridium ghonii TaxID=29358 RepID=UPI00202CB057|nr:hypothetical protein [Paeniclostridium ghonii]MCM0167587.1 hypothetical protein [Paeniclostridium ghonii]